MVQPSTLPLLPFALPIAIGFILAAWAATLTCYGIFPESVGVSLEHRRQGDPRVACRLLVPRFVDCPVVWCEDVVSMFLAELNLFSLRFGGGKGVFRGAALHFLFWGVVDS